MEAACWRHLEVEMPGGLDDLLSDPSFRRKLLKRIAEGWTFEKIKPMSTDEIFARLNRVVAEYSVRLMLSGDGSRIAGCWLSAR